jgi:hypothetical protein
VATPISFDPATWNTSVATPFTVGARYTYLGREFVFCQNSTDAAIADGVVAVRASASSYIVTGTNRATSLVGAGANGPIAGVGVGAISVSYYGFLLTRGDHVNVIGVATVTVGRAQYASATNDSGSNSVNLYDHTFGVALSALSGGRYTVQVGGF